MEVSTAELAGLVLAGVRLVVSRNRSPLRWLTVVLLGITVALPLYVLTRLRQATRK